MYDGRHFSLKMRRLFMRPFNNFGATRPEIEALSVLFHQPVVAQQRGSDNCARQCRPEFKGEATA